MGPRGAAGARDGARLLGREDGGVVAHAGARARARTGAGGRRVGASCRVRRGRRACGRRHRPFAGHRAARRSRGPAPAVARGASGEVRQIPALPVAVLRGAGAERARRHGAGHVEGSRTGAVAARTGGRGAVVASGAAAGGGGTRATRARAAALARREPVARLLLRLRGGGSTRGGRGAPGALPARGAARSGHGSRGGGARAVSGGEAVRRVGRVLRAPGSCVAVADGRTHDDRRDGARAGDVDPDARGQRGLGLGFVGPLVGGLPLRAVHGAVRGGGAVRRRPRG